MPNAVKLSVSHADKLSIPTEMPKILFPPAPEGYVWKLKTESLFSSQIYRVALYEKVKNNFWNRHFPPYALMESPWVYASDVTQEWVNEKIAEITHELNLIEYERRFAAALNEGKIVTQTEGWSNYQSQLTSTVQD